MNGSYILDACAILALLKDEPGADIVEGILVCAKENACAAMISKYNLLEVYYGFYREDGEDIANKRLQAIMASPLTIIDNLSDDVFKQAGRLKAGYKISLADSIVLAEGITRDAVVVSSDHHEFDIIERSENIRFHWIR